MVRLDWLLLCTFCITEVTDVLATKKNLFDLIHGSYFMPFPTQLQSPMACWWFTTKESMFTLKMQKRKQFTLDVNGYCHKNSSIRLLLMESLKCIMEPIDYFFMTGQYIHVIFTGLVIVCHLHYLDILRKNGNGWKTTHNK